MQECFGYFVNFNEAVVQFLDVLTNFRVFFRKFEVFSFAEKRPKNTQKRAVQLRSPLISCTLYDFTQRPSMPQGLPHRYEP